MLDLRTERTTMADPTKTTHGAKAEDVEAKTPAKVLPHQREPKFRLLVNPQGGMIPFNLDPASTERFEDLLVTQRPPKMKPKDWYREAEPEELAAYMEESGHFFHDDDRAEWETRQVARNKAALERRKALQDAVAKR